MPERYLPIAALIIIAVSFVAVLLLAAWFFRPKKALGTSMLPFECGNSSIDSSRTMFNSRFIQIAFLFLIFEIEIALLMPWMTRVADFGWQGLVKAGAFVVFMLLALGYAVKRGDLEWE